MATTTDFNTPIIRHTDSLKTRNLSAATLVISSSANPGKPRFMRNDIKSALEKLPEEYSLPLILFFEGYKYQEIADYFVIPIDEIKMRTQAARKQLKNSLNPYSSRVAQSA